MFLIGINCRTSIYVRKGINFSWKLISFHLYTEIHMKFSTFFSLFSCNSLLIYCSKKLTDNITKYGHWILYWMKFQFLMQRFSSLILTLSYLWSNLTYSGISTIPWWFWNILSETCDNFHRKSFVMSSHYSFCVNTSNRCSTNS